ncbi:MAG: InlB B-repeat-containing protein, partial [Clostridia bacterium]|nr:InlB B-repeat-containing protein [Clostridia bacterium]
MIKRILKRTLSTLLAIIMVVMTFCFADMSLLFPRASAALSSSSYPDVYIVVPETFYMTPSLTSSTTVQYYINNTLSGTTLTPDAVRDATTGKIYFNVSSGTVANLKYSIIGTNKTNVDIYNPGSVETLSGVTLNTGMTATNTRTLEWIFTCTIDGIPAEYHAYTVAYAPYYAPVGAGYDVQKECSHYQQMQGAAWISGVHSYSESYHNSSDSSLSIETRHRIRVVQDGYWWGPLVPLITPITAPLDKNQSMWDWFVDLNDNPSSNLYFSEPTFTTSYLHKGKSGASDIEVALRSQQANITVDISRNKNFNTVPNLTTGFFNSDLQYNKWYMGSYGGYMANYAGNVPDVNFYFNRNNNYYGAGGGSFTETHANGVDDTTFFLGNTDANKNTRNYNYYDLLTGNWNRATPTSTGTSECNIHAAMIGEYEGDWEEINIYLFVSVTAVSKAALRNKLFQKQYRANAKMVDDYAYVRSLLEDGYRALGDPTASQATVDAACSALDGVDNYISNTQTVTAKHLSAKTGSQIPGAVDESLTTRRTDTTLSVTPNSYTGYTYTGTRRTYSTAAAYGLFDANAWAASSCNAGGSGVSSVAYDPLSRTITVNNSGTETNTAFPTGNVLSSGYNYIEVDPSTAYTIDFDYASAARGKVGVICYDQSGDYVGSAWLYDSFKATGGTSTFRHCTDVIFPQANPALAGSMYRFAVHYIVLTFGTYAEGSQSASTAVFRNVSVTANNELFDLAQWYQGSSSYRSGTNATGIGYKSYNSETKTLTISSTEMDTNTAYTTSNVTTDVDSGDANCPWNYIPVSANTTYSVEGLYAGTGNGQITIAHYNTYGSFTEATTLDYTSGILTKTGDSANFDPFFASFTTRADDSYIALAFGGNPNAGASVSAPVTNVFRDVKLHASASGNDVYTLYYRPHTYTVSFNGNGNTNTSATMADMLFCYDEAQNLTSSAFERVFTVTYDAHSGSVTTTAANTTATSTFNGWAATANGAKIYNDQQSVSNLTAVDQTVVPLYANWTDNAVTLPSASRMGYTFNGWYTEPTGGTLIGTSGSYTPSADITLHAQWTAHTFTVAFHNNGVGPAGNMPASLTPAYDSSIDALPYPRVSKIDGWEFRGWSTTSGGTSVDYNGGGAISAAAIRSVYDSVGSGGTYDLYAVWRKTLTATFVDYASGSQQTRSVQKYVFNGSNATIPTAEIPEQSAHTDWTQAGWTLSRQKGAVGSTVTSVSMSSAGLFDFDDWAASSSNGSTAAQTTTVDSATHSITAYAANGDTASPYYNGDNVFTSGYDYFAVDPYYTYTFSFEYASDQGGKVGVICYDADGNYLGCPWFSPANSGGNNLQGTGGYSDNDFQAASIVFCPATYSLNSNSYLSVEDRTQVRYVSLVFGTYSSGGAVTAKYRNISFMQNITYYGVYTQEVTLTYDPNTTDTVTGMPAPLSASQNRYANSALGFSAEHIQDPTFALSSATPERTGYTFKGWNTDRDATAGATSGSVTLSASARYYTIWEANKIVVSFDVNEPYTDSDAAVDPTSLEVTFAAAYGTLPTPTCSGYDFEAWHKDSANGAVISATSTVTDAAAHTLYATWTPAEYTVTLNSRRYADAFDATGTAALTDGTTSVTATYDAAMPAITVPTMTGYDFGGYYSVKLGTGTQYYDESGSSAHIWDQPNTATLYAKWTAKTVTVSFDANGDVSDPATVSPSTKNVTFGSAYDTLPTPQRNGYDFDGWFTGRTDGTLVTASTTVNNENAHTIYAHWSKAEYTLTVTTTQGGTVSGSYISGAAPASISVGNNTSENYTVTYSFSVYDLVPTVLSAGYTFDGWTATGLTLTSAQQTSTNLTITMPYTAVTLTAKFKANEYTITYKPGTNATGEEKTQNCTYDADVVLYTNAEEAAATKTAFK